MIQVYLNTIPGLENLRLNVNDYGLSTSELNSTLKSKLPEKVAKRSIIATTNGSSILNEKTVKELLTDQSVDYLNLHLRIPMCGGKGGFGSALKKNGTKMNSNKKNNGDLSEANNCSKDNYRTLTGMKLKTLKKLEKLEKLEQLKKANSINFHNNSNDTSLHLKKISEKKEKLLKILNIYPELILRKDSKFDDSKYLDDLDQVMEDIKKSVGSALDTSSDESNGNESDGDEGNDFGDIDHETDDTDAMTDYSIPHFTKNTPIDSCILGGPSVLQGSTKDLVNSRNDVKRRSRFFTSVARRDDPTSTTDDYLGDEDVADANPKDKIKIGTSISAKSIGSRVDSFFD